MNHDITHCSGIDQNKNICSRRNQCHRYLAHLDEHKGHSGMIGYYHVQNVNLCSGMFWPEDSLNPKNVKRTLDLEELIQALNNVGNRLSSWSGVETNISSVEFTGSNETHDFKVTLKE